MTVTLTVNDRPCSWECSASETLAEALRARGFTSVKCGCSEGACGMCTVWLDGRPVLSCSVLVSRLDGRRVTTVEGMEEEARVIGSYLVAQGADQCGFCAPGYIMTVLAMVRELPAPITEDQVRHYLAGNLCRCTGYQSKLRGVLEYLAERKKPDFGQ